VQTVNLNALSERYTRIFLLSHMRAFTSLAGHILGSHPQINGYFEMHISYDDASALGKQLEVLRECEDIKVNSRYIFDKLLHNDYLLECDRLGVGGTNIPAVKILVALREPQQTIKSIVNLFAQKATAEPYASAVEATSYYIERLITLADFCRTADQQYYYFDAAMLQSAPEVLLPGLSRWLGLDSPLSDNYGIFSQTGEARRGDTSKLIQSGKISKTRNDYSHIQIPQEQLKTAQQIYRDCRRQIIDNATDSVIYERDMPASA